jgi:hypothetical protein
VLTPLVILGLALLPPLISIWGAKRCQRVARLRLQAAARATRYRMLSMETRPSQPEQYHLLGVGDLVGDISCRYNARSPHLRCAINPSGPCGTCYHYEAIEHVEE